MTWQERLEAAAREHEKSAAELLALSEEKLSLQVRPLERPNVPTPNPHPLRLTPTPQPP